MSHIQSEPQFPRNVDGRQFAIHEFGNQSDFPFFIRVSVYPRILAAALGEIGATQALQFQRDEEGSLKTPDRPGGI